RTAMLEWLRANGYPPDSLEGQAKYMAHEAMTGKGYGPTRNVLMTATEDPQSLYRGTDIITKNFEAPRIANTGRRYQDTQTALRARKPEEERTTTTPQGPTQGPTTQGPTESKDALLQYHLSQGYPTSGSSARTGGQAANLSRMSPD